MNAQRPDRATLLEIVHLRSGAAYQAAEFLRRRLGASTMADFPPTSEEYAAIRLLIGTWDAIAHMVNSGDIDKVKFFETNPLLLMWDHLSGAVDKIRLIVSPIYAKDFEDLATEYRQWIVTDDGRRRYRSSSDQAIHALFG